MAVEHAIWTVGDAPARLAGGRLPSEQMLEEMIVRDPRIISGEWLLIGRQEVTTFGGRIDLLAIAPDGSLVLIELKRDRTPREIVAQALDYASWVGDLTSEKIAQIFHRFSGGESLDTAFVRRFGTAIDEGALNGSHQIVIVASELDASTERIVQYLNARDVPINVVFFQVFEHRGELLLSRAWLIDPAETVANAGMSAASMVEKEPWNGEFYVSFGDPDARSWDDARRYGYISAGGGSWYSQTLRLLSPGDRVWVKIPKVGHVGVGRVTEAVQSVKDFTVPTSEGDRPALEVLGHAARYAQQSDDPVTAEYFVRVRWLHAVPAGEAINEVGLFGNQNSVCKPQTPKWRLTVERLKTAFSNWNAE